jgi:hypothetical protein
MSFVDDTDFRYTQIPSTTNASVTQYLSTNANVTIASSVTISGVTHTITSIDVSAGVFQNNTTVTEITVPASIATISNNTFKGASNVATINLLHPGLPTLETYAFDGLPSTCTINFRSVTNKNVSKSMIFLLQKTQKSKSTKKVLQFFKNPYK